MAERYRIRLQASPWRSHGPSYPRAWRNGLLLPRAGLLARAFLPSSADRRAIGDDAYPYWYVLDYAALPALASADSQIIPEQDFTLLTLAGSSQQLAGIRTQFYQVLPNDTGLRLSRLPVNRENLLGSGALPFILRRPYSAPNRFALLNRTLNRAAVANTAQIVLFGMKQTAAGPVNRIEPPQQVMNP